MTASINASTSSGVVVTSDTSGVLALQTAGTTAVTINSSQYVGIGTTNPTTPLIVHTADGAGIGVENAASTQYRIAVNNDNSFSLVQTGTAERLRVDTSGNLLVKTSNAGIVFNNSSASTNSTLNDYEVGTWTPSPVGLTVVGTATYTGKYTKIGNQVTCWLNIDSTTSTAATGGTTSIGGLPFSASPVSNSSIGGGTVISSNGVNQVGSGYIYTANNRFYVSGWTATANIVITITYQATF